MYKLVLIRHGESQWNKENRFTGWKDVDLSEKGVDEAHAAGRLLKAEGFEFDEAYTSVLKRAIRTLWIILDEMDLMWVPVVSTFRRILSNCRTNAILVTIRAIDRSVREDSRVPSVSRTLWPAWSHTFSLRSCQRSSPENA